MKNKKISAHKNTLRATDAQEHSKHIDRWWLKYETAGDLAEEPIPHKLFFEFADSAYEMWLQSGNNAAQIEADIAHHIAVQKIFKKWRKVYGDKI